MCQRNVIKGSRIRYDVISSKTDEVSKIISVPFGLEGRLSQMDSNHGK